MNNGTRRTVLVTGASTGIGFATAHALDRAGWRVFAAVRREIDTVHLKRALADDARMVILDVTKPEQIAAAVAEIARETGGRLDAVVNNAGIVVMGPVEALSSAAIRTQFDVNVFGLLDVTRACLPMLRAARGRIVNVGSISGRVAWPLSGVYAASKHALEALCDALRVELGGFGVKVVLIQPGAIDTPIWNKPTPAAMRELAHLEPAVAERYRRLFAIVDETLALVQKQSAPVESVARTIVRALAARAPRARYRIGGDATMQLVARAIPTAVRDRALIFGLERMLRRRAADEKTTPPARAAVPPIVISKNGTAPAEPQPA